MSGRSDYQERQEARRARLEAAAEKNAAKAAAAQQSADQLAGAIPMGQPILVGHHSEKRHRRDLDRIQNNTRKSVEAQDRAASFKRAAANIGGTRTVSSDDPEAIDKLRAKLAKCERKQEAMKAANKIVKLKRFSNDEKVAQLVELLEVSASKAAALLEPDFAGRVGFPSYAITNNGAEMRRLRKRIAALEAEQGAEHVEEQYGEIRYVEDVDDNRVYLYFPGKPEDEVRAMLKRRGFRWTPSVGAWGRQLNDQARYHGRQIATEVAEGIA